MKTLDDWKNVHQPFELDYHATKGIAWCSDESRFHSYWAHILEFAGISGDEIALDIGCGPRPPLQDHVRHLTVIEPLAEEYQALTPPEWWEGIDVHSTPAEKKLKLGTFDLVLCWNCLDHTHDWKGILKNVHTYLKDDGVFILATDTKPPCIGHPSFPYEELLAEIGKYFRTEKEVHNFSERDHAFVLRKV